MIRSLIIFCILLSLPITLWSVPQTDVDEAISFLKTACVISGEKLSIDAGVGGSLSIKKLKNSGASVSIEFSREKIEGLTNEINRHSASQASEMRQCMKPYIDKILNIYFTGSAEQETQKVEVEVPGSYFSVAELDEVLVVLANQPKTLFSFNDVVDRVNIHPAKVRSCLETGIANELLVYYISNADKKLKGYVLESKGLDYVLNKGLIK